jgi:hypothetical protein
VRLVPVTAASGRLVGRPNDRRISCKRLARHSLTNVPLLHTERLRSSEIRLDALVGCMRWLGNSCSYFSLTVKEESRGPVRAISGRVAGQSQRCQGIAELLDRPQCQEPPQ